MKPPVDSSVMSHSQSEVNFSKDKEHLILGTTTKLDSFFPILDQISLKARIPIILYILAAVYLYYQVFLTSLYPFCKYWNNVFQDKSFYTSNSKVISIFSCMEDIALFFHYDDESNETDLFIPLIVLVAFFGFSLIVIIIQIFGSTHNNKVNKFFLYVTRFVLDIISPLMLIPSSSVFGFSIRNLSQGGSKLNWAYLFVSLILYLIFLIFSYLSITILNQSTCLLITPFSSFSIKLPLFLPLISSLFFIFQCLFSLFQFWAMIIVQLTHLVVSIIVFYPMCYLTFHNKYSNVFFNAITMTTWLNDIIFVIFYFISSPKLDKITNKTNIYYILGLILPLVCLVVSIISAFFYVIFRIKSVTKELKKFTDEDDNIIVNDQSTVEVNDTTNQDSNYFPLFANHKLFKTENLTMMSIHLSFTNCLPLFYKCYAINYALHRFPSNIVVMSIIQYLSFFPGSSRNLNNCLKVVCQNRELKYHQRFLLFQIFRIKTLRQSSVSSEANTVLAELKSSSNQVLEDIISFWGLKKVSIPYLEMISKENSTVGNKWEQSIRDFPNFQKFCDEYCSYLIESRMNLTKALVMKHRSDLLELGSNFTVDVPFISLARSYPTYLKNKVVDHHGNFIQKSRETSNTSGSLNITSKSSISSKSGGSSSSNNVTNGSEMLKNDFELNPDLVEAISKKLLTQSSLRLELNRALANKSSFAARLMIFNAFIVFIIGFAILIGLFFYIDSYIDSRNNSMLYLNLATKVRFYADLAILGSTIKFAYFTKRFRGRDYLYALDDQDDIGEIDSTNKEYNESSYSGYNPDLFLIDDEIPFNLIHRNVIISQSFFNQFISALTYLTSIGKNIYEITTNIMNNEVSFYSCFLTIPTGEKKMSLKALESYLLLVIDQTASKSTEDENWFHSDEICEIYANQDSFEKSTLNLFESLVNYEVSQSDKEDKILKILAIVFPIVPLLAYFIPIIIYVKLFFVDLEKIMKILLDINAKYKEESKKAIRKDSYYEIPSVTEKKVKSNNWVILWVLLTILCIINSVLILLTVFETKNNNSTIKKLGRWNLLSSLRLTNAVEALNYMLNSVLLNGSSTFNISSSQNVKTTQAKMIRFCQLSLHELMDSNEELLKGNEFVPGCSGFDNEIDRINFLSTCDVSGNKSNIHDSYRCASLSQTVGIFISMINSVLEDVNTTGGVFDNEKIIHSLHILNRHLLQRLELLVDRFNNLNLDKCKKLEKNLIILLTFGIILNVIIFFNLLAFYVKSSSVYQTAMILIQRLPPRTFLFNKRLLNFILNRKDTQDESEMSVTQSAIYMSHDAIICTNGNGVVEIINPSVTNILGYTPEQMLGQSISNFFANNNLDQQEKDKNKEKENETSLSDADKIINQIEFMKNGQSALVFQEHFTCLTDDDKEIPCGVTILAMTNKNDNGNTSSSSSTSVGTVESFVFIIRDETQLIQQQREAEAAKSQSENLLFQILPRDIVVRINSGEKDISFTVQSASVIFIDVVKFSEYASNLTPQEIMGSLSTLFASFDACAKKYELLTKIKLIGDIYMAAAGLFSDENVQPKEHAEQILTFGIDCLDVLDEVNIKLNANLQLRIGVNSGGPVLAGVLGTDKPVFDIIGDPINVAARLQTTDVPGKVQISKSTYDLVFECNFYFEERGDVFLKGKGKTTAYLVSQMHQNAFISESSG